MRVLVTGVGGAAGISVLSSLRNEPDCFLVGVDADVHARGQFLADRFLVVPTADSEDFIPALINASRGCDALFCTVDEELPVVAAARGEFASRVFVPEPGAVESCLDKLQAARLLDEGGVPAPRTWPYERRAEAVREIGFPLVVKPVRSRGSRDVFTVATRRALDAVGELVSKRLLVQEYLPDPEFTIDVLADGGSHLASLVARERVRTKGGVTTVGRTVDPGPFIEPVRRILSVFGLKHIVMVQFRSDPPKVLEVGPRPAGTMILSTRVGVNMPLMLLKDGLLETRMPSYPRDVWFFRCEQDVIVPPAFEERPMNKEVRRTGVITA